MNKGKKGNCPNQDVETGNRKSRLTQWGMAHMLGWLIMTSFELECHIGGEIFWIIVLLQNPSSLQLELTNLPIYQSGKGYKAISKALGLPRTTVRGIIYKWPKHGTVENLPRSGRPTKITPRVQRQLIQEVTKDPTTTSKELQASLASVKLLKFADDTTVIGLIQDGDESAYRQEVEQLAAWCSLNNLELNTLKTVEMIVDFRRNTRALPPLTIMNSTVPTVESFRFLGTTISQDLKWDTHIDATIKKAQQRLYFLRQLRKFNLPQELLTQFYSAVIESVRFMSITVWFGSATKSDIRRLQRTVRTAERIIGAPLPTLQELYTSRVRKRALKITLDPSHPGHILFDLLPSGRRYRAATTRTARHKNSFFPQAIYLLNS
ncbi:hypothetical protein QTP70_009422 [Hemibagrus guttatus]|uniref:Alkylated DNA repair protein AlkB homologue 8 N-terminal domain-containing protein n=1 Tax=Hemibagrus guttatus TaxID=175788 RepID=A0AAE0QAR2_9TELE|nr:hypothetical protein QTP70_009422 [Hemibagrus guttatus]